MQRVSPRTCSVDGCEAHVHARGLCSRHRHRLNRYGDPRKWEKRPYTFEECLLEDGEARVPLRNRDQIIAWAIIDAADWPLVGDSNWFMVKGYAVRVSPTDYREHQYMHRVVLGLQKGDPRVGDHINFSRLDNRRCNLRIVTPAQNQAWRPNFELPVSAVHPDVYWDAAQGEWVTVERVEVGRFRSERAAVAAARPASPKT